MATQSSLTSNRPVGIQSESKGLLKGCWAPGMVNKTDFDLGDYRPNGGRWVVNQET